MTIADALKIISLNPLWRIKRHADYLKDKVVIDDERDATNFSHVHNAVDSAIRKLRIYYWIRFVLFVLLYVSAITAFVEQTTPFLTDLLEPISGIAAIVGVSVLTVLFLIFSKLISAVMEDLRTAHAHMVALAVKHGDGIVHPEHKMGLYMHYR